MSDKSFFGVITDNIVHFAIVASIFMIIGVVYGKSIVQKNNSEVYVRVSSHCQAEIQSASRQAFEDDQLIKRE